MWQVVFTPMQWPSIDFRLGQFYKFVYKLWWPCTKYIGLVLYGWMNKHLVDLICKIVGLLMSQLQCSKHIEPKSSHMGLEGALNGTWLQHPTKTWKSFHKDVHGLT